MADPRGMSPEIRDRIRAWLRHYLTRRGWTQAKLAKRIGIKESTLSTILSGRRGAGFDVAYKMHVALKVSLDDLCDEYPEGAAGSAGPEE